MISITGLVSHQTSVLIAYFLGSMHQRSERDLENFSFLRRNLEAAQALQSGEPLHSWETFSHKHLFCSTKSTSQP